MIIGFFTINIENQSFFITSLYSSTASFATRTTSKIYLLLTKAAYSTKIVDSRTSLNLKDKILYTLVILKFLTLKALSFFEIKQTKVAFILNVII